MKSSLFKEPNGQVSSTRIMAFMVVSVTLIVWGALSVMRGEFVPIPMEQIGLVLGAMGIKVWQKGKEK